MGFNRPLKMSGRNEKLPDIMSGAENSVISWPAWCMILVSGLQNNGFFADSMTSNGCSGT